MTAPPTAWEQFVPGVRLETAARTITETDIVFWSGMAGDWNPVHSDTEQAQKGPFGQRIAHGNIALCLSVGLASQSNRASYRPAGFLRSDGWEGLRFTAPVFIGDDIRTVRTLLDATKRGDGTGILKYRVEVLKQDDTIVLVGVERLIIDTTGPLQQERNGAL